MTEPALTATEALKWNQATNDTWRKLLSEHPEILSLPCDIMQVSTVAQVPGMAGVAVDAHGNLFVSSLANLILRVAPDGAKSVYAGSGGEPASNVGALADGPLATALFFKPFALAFSHADDLYVADTRNSRVRKVVK